MYAIGGMPNDVKSVGYRESVNNKFEHEQVFYSAKHDFKGTELDFLGEGLAYEYIRIDAYKINIKYGLNTILERIRSYKIKLQNTPISESFGGNEIKEIEKMLKEKDYLEIQKKKIIFIFNEFKNWIKQHKEGNLK